MIGASSSNSSVSPCTVRDTTSRDFFASPRSSYSPNTSQTQSSASRSRWFSNFLPVQGNEDHSADMNDLALLQELEQAEEVTEKSNLDAAAEDREMPLAFNSARHLSAYEEDPEAGKTNSWRIRERMKTVSVALVCCLNVGVDPPDVTKTQPCARLECWVDPTVLNPQKAIEAIGNNLQKQYERWQPKARYRSVQDFCCFDTFIQNIFTGKVLTLHWKRYDVWLPVLDEMPVMNEFFSTTTAMVFPSPQPMERSGSLTATTPSIFP